MCFAVAKITNVAKTPLMVSDPIFPVVESFLTVVSITKTKDIS
jgi:hypothetical protein